MRRDADTYHPPTPREEFPSSMGGLAGFGGLGGFNPFPAARYSRKPKYVETEEEGPFVFVKQPSAGFIANPHPSPPVFGSGGPLPLPTTTGGMLLGQPPPSAPAAASHSPPSISSTLSHSASSRPKQPTPLPKTPSVALSLPLNRITSGVGNNSSPAINSLPTPPPPPSRMASSAAPPGNPISVWASNMADKGKSAATGLTRLPVLPPREVSLHHHPSMVGELEDLENPSTGRLKSVRARSAKVRPTVLTDIYLNSCQQFNVLTPLTKLEEKLQRAPELNLNHRGLADNGLQAIASVLTEPHQVEELYLGYNSIGELGAEALAAALQNVPQLRYVDLSNNWLLGLQGSVRLLQCRHVSVLNLASNRIDDNAAEMFAAALTPDGNGRGEDEPCSLDLSKNNLGPKFGHTLSFALRSTRFLVKLDLSWNNIGALGFAELCTGLKENTSLSTLLLVRIGSVADCGLLADVVSSHPKLKELDISQNRIDAESVRPLFQALKANTCLRRLRLEGNAIEAPGWAYAFDALAVNVTLQELDLRKTLLAGTRLVDHDRLTQDFRILHDLKPPPAVKSSVSGMVNVALGARTWSSLEPLDGSRMCTADKATDGLPNTCFRAVPPPADDPAAVWLAVDLGCERALHSVRIRFEGEHWPAEFAVFLADDPTPVGPSGQPGPLPPSAPVEPADGCWRLSVTASGRKGWNQILLPPSALGDPEAARFVKLVQTKAAGSASEPQLLLLPGRSPASTSRPSSPPTASVPGTPAVYPNSGRRGSTGSPPAGRSPRSSPVGVAGVGGVVLAPSPWAAVGSPFGSAPQLQLAPGCPGALALEPGIWGDFRPSGDVQQTASRAAARFLSLDEPAPASVAASLAMTVASSSSAAVATGAGTGRPFEAASGTTSPGPLSPVLLEQPSPVFVPPLVFGAASRSGGEWRETQAGHSQAHEVSISYVEVYELPQASNQTLLSAGAKLLARTVSDEHWRQCTLIIDKSASMKQPGTNKLKTRWDETRDAACALAQQCLRSAQINCCDTFFCSSKGKDEHIAIGDVELLERRFEQAPDDGLAAYNVLAPCMAAALRVFPPSQAHSIIVFVAGETLDTPAVLGVVGRFAQTVSKMPKQRQQQVRLHFVQVGDDAATGQQLRRFVNDLRGVSSGVDGFVSVSTHAADWDSAGLLASARRALD
eukprot:TRINITY_DN3174_c0_g1_i1.p1 TRINITY_DN3174_c0_g1~~TRINITY_DN3174_c0_g1_i1.p1  ORF type:complete len:1174 (-),score=440.91 TRINITY_DN3174_c0_g1_i1:184-3705(-)